MTSQMQFLYPDFCRESAGILRLFSINPVLFKDSIEATYGRCYRHIEAEISETKILPITFEGLFILTNIHHNLRQC